MVAATSCCSWCLLQTEMWHIKYGLMIGRSQDTGWQREIRILDICVDYMYFTSINKIYVRPTLERWISHLWSYNLFQKFYEWDFSLLCSSKSKYKLILKKIKWKFWWIILLKQSVREILKISLMFYDSAQDECSSCFIKMLMIQFEMILKIHPNMRQWESKNSFYCLVKQSEQENNGERFDIYCSPPASIR